MFNPPNLLTACNMLCGILAILLSVSGHIEMAPFAIFIGAILDFLDGFVARLLKQQGELGKQLDSLADMITFGLAPGVIMLVVLVFVMHTEIPASGWKDLSLLSKHVFVQTSLEMWMTNFDISVKSLLPLTALIIPFFSMFRLAKFNIDTRQSESFIGLPTPANTIFFTGFPLILMYRQFAAEGFERTLTDRIFQPVVIIPVIVVMSLLLVSEIPLFSLKFKRFGWKGNEIRYTFLVSCAVLIPLLVVWSIPIIVLLYLFLSVIENIFFKHKQHEIQS